MNARMLAWTAAIAAMAVAAPAAGLGATANDPASSASGSPSSPSVLDSLLSATPLDLALLERAVIERNPSLAAMRAAWVESAARADRAGGLDDPMADVQVAPRALGSDLQGPGYMVGLSQKFPLFGQRGDRSDAARAEARAAGEDARSLGLDLVRDARRLYSEWYLVARGTEVNRELSGLLEQFRRIALAKYAAGTVGEQDALQAEVELAMLDHEAVVLQRERRIVQARMNALLHRDPAADLPAPVASLAPVDSAAEAAPAPADSALHRPQVLAANAQRDARAAELSLAKKSRLPDFTFQAGYNGMMAEPEMRPYVGVGFNLPIWFGQYDAEERQASAALERANQERLALIDRVQAELTEARARVEDTRHEVHIIEMMVVPATERALASSRVGYETNRSDFLTLLNAARDLARAQYDEHRAQADYLSALADLDRALGRGAGEPLEVTR
jgi:cobalt-zinc-cadmium efflux system outer membrane protein